AQRVEAFVDNDIEREWNRNISPADLSVELNDGTTQRLRVDWPLGHPRRPMSAADFDTKAIDCFRVAERMLPDDSPGRLRRCVDALRSRDVVCPLAGILEP